MLVAPENIPVGPEWHKETVSESMQECTHFLVIISHASTASERILTEITLAQEQLNNESNLTILPLIIENVGAYPGSEFIESFQHVPYQRDDSAQLSAVAECLDLRPTGPEQKSVRSPHLRNDKATSLQCLVFMPFGSEFNVVFDTVKAAATSSVPTESIHCYWLKDVLAAGRITDDILEGIHRSAFCIADLTDNNPNVMWETGYAMALSKPTILIAQNVDTIPFDLKDHRIVPYELQELNSLPQKLSEAIRQTLSRYKIRTATYAETHSQDQGQVIAVTGSMVADAARVQRRIDTILEPYLNSLNTWYCGTNGIVDEMSLDYLLDHNQRPIAVGYHKLDFSARVFELVQQNKIRFIDASVEPLPKGLTGPSDRDVLFASKADLTVLFWDGESRGTRTLIDYYQHNAKNLVIGFI